MHFFNIGYLNLQSPLHKVCLHQDPRGVFYFTVVKPRVSGQ